MNQPGPPYREIVEEHTFSAELKALGHDARRLDEFIDGAKWVLSRECAAGTRIGSSVVWFYSIAVSKAVDPVVLFYTFDKDHVFFLSIRKTTYPPKETGE